MTFDDVVIVDYGVGNLYSVQRALKHLDASVEVTSDPEKLLRAQKVVLPGVGAFNDSVDELTRLGLFSALREVVTHGSILLGICLGMQLLFDESEEFGLTAGLGIIPGRVVPIPKKAIFRGKPIKIPNIGWNELKIMDNNQIFERNLLKGIEPDATFYFLHSFMAEPAERQHQTAYMEYGELQIAAIVCKENVFGCQFHPEKSGEYGLKILKNFLDM